MNARFGASLALLTLVACGYHAAYGGAASEHLHVLLLRAPVADAIAADEVASGVREELAREGALAPGANDYPRVEIEVTRIDESSEAIAAGTASDGTRAPVAGATNVGVVARAWIARAANGSHERDTGDLRALDLVGRTADGTATADVAAVDALRHDDAVRAAARRVGIALARRLLGAPVPTEDTLSP